MAIPRRCTILQLENGDDRQRAFHFLDMSTGPWYSISEHSLLGTERGKMSVETKRLELTIGCQVLSMHRERRGRDVNENGDN